MERNCEWCTKELTGPKPVSEKECIFCNFDNKDAIIAEDDLFIALLSKAPLNKHHVIIIPKKHYTDTSEVPDTVLAKMYVLAKKVGKAIKKAAKAEGISFVHDDGITKTMEHFTLHIFPRFNKDKICGHFIRQKDPGSTLRKKYANQIKQFL